MDFILREHMHKIIIVFIIYEHWVTELCVFREICFCLKVFVFVKQEMMLMCLCCLELQLEQKSLMKGKISKNLSFKLPRGF